MELLVVLMEFVEFSLSIILTIVAVVDVVDESTTYNKKRERNETQLLCLAIRVLWRAGGAKLSRNLQ